MRTEGTVNEIYSKYRNLIEESGKSWMKLPVMNGLVGISVFNDLNYWQWTMFGSIDLMHLFEGIFSILMKLWTESKVCLNK